MRKPHIAIVNSSTFGKHFNDHLKTLESFADLSRTDVAANISASELYPKLQHADGIIASVSPKFTREFLENCPKLVLLFRHGIGCDNVDLAAATELGIMVSRVQGWIERDAVAEHAISLLMSASRYTPQGNSAVREGRWAARSHMIGLELKNKTIGIIGLGNIGSRSAEILSKGFDADVIAYDPHVNPQKFQQHGAKSVGLDELLRKSSAVLFHCPLTPETKRFISAVEFSKMKKGSILINTCRGELVNEDDLFDALNSGHLGCYATDVVEGEPIDGNHRLAKLPNVIITPHLGGFTWESLQGMGQTGVDDMLAVFTQGAKAKELANPEVLLSSRLRNWK